MTRHCNITAPLTTSVRGVGGVGITGGLVQGKTGVEMEALTGASVAALTFYDMTKALSHEIVIRNTRLLHKRGGKSDYTDVFA